MKENPTLSINLENFLRCTTLNQLELKCPVPMLIMLTLDPLLLMLEILMVMESLTLLVKLIKMDSYLLLLLLLFTLSFP